MHFFHHATGRALAAVATLSLAAACRGDSARAAGGDVADAAPDTAAYRGAPSTPVPATPDSAPATGVVSRAVRTAPSGSPPAAARSSAASGERSSRRVVIAGVDLTGIGYDMGSATAPIVIVDFSDFGCPFCASHARQTLPALEREYVATGKVFYKYVPFVMGMFPNGDKAARAAECAADQGKFWAMHDRLFATQSEWKRSLSPFQLFKADAAALGLDGARFSSCYVGQKTDARTQQATDRANELGIRATPTLVVNGQAVEGALPIDEFRKLLGAASLGASQGGAPGASR